MRVAFVHPDLGIGELFSNYNYSNWLK